MPFVFENERVNKRTREINEIIQTNKSAVVDHERGVKQMRTGVVGQMRRNVIAERYGNTGRPKTSKKFGGKADQLIAGFDLKKQTVKSLSSKTNFCAIG